MPSNTTYVAGTLTVDGDSIAGALDTSSVLNLNSVASGASTVIVLSVDINTSLPTDAAWITSAVITDYDESSESVVSDNDTSGHCGISDDGYDHALDAGVLTYDDDPTKLPLLQATTSETCILAFEDLKDRGWNDWDMNDLILNVASYYMLDGDNNVEAMFVTYHVIARGAGSDSALHLNMPYSGYGEWQTLYLNTDGSTDASDAGFDQTGSLSVRLWESSKNALPPYTGPSISGEPAGPSASTPPIPENARFSTYTWTNRSRTRLAALPSPHTIPGSRLTRVQPSTNSSTILPAAKW